MLQEFYIVSAPLYVEGCAHLVFSSDLQPLAMIVTVKGT